MRKIGFFLLLLTLAASSILVLFGVGWYQATTPKTLSQSNLTGSMWGGMMGGMGGGMMGDNYGTWILVVGLLAVAVAAVIGISFYLLFPEIKSSKSTCAPSPGVQSQTDVSQPGVTANTTNSSSNSSSCDVLSKTMTPDEQKVLRTLRAHEGKYLQKYIAKEAGLSRLKTHRIIARFAQRGIVTAKPIGNTNEIELSDWVKASEKQNSNALPHA